MTYEVGMLGYRFMGRAHANALARLPMFFPDAPAVERGVLVGREPDALEAARERLGFERTETNWAEAIDRVDVFYNLGPNHVHAEPSIAALEAGVPVLCEKPLGNTLAEAQSMAEAARSADVPAICAFNYRFVPAIQYAKGLIQRGDLGEVHHVRGRYLQDWLVDPEAPWSWRNSRELAGSGALGDLGSHLVDLVRYLVGDVERVSGQLATVVEERPVADEEGTRPVTVDDAFTAEVRLGGGAVGTIEASRVATGHKNDLSLEVNGSTGSLRFSLERLNELEYHAEGDRGYQTILVTDEDDPFVDRWWPPGHVLGWEHTFVHENYEFLRAVSTGEVSASLPTFEDGLAAQRVLTAVEESDERGEWLDPR